MLCPRCKNEIGEDAQFCSHCGMKIKRCPSCHQPIFEASKYCSYCGTAIHDHLQNNQVGGYYQPIDHSQVISKEKPKGSFKDIPANKKVNIPIIVISVLVLVVLTVGGYIYLQKTHDINIFNDDKVENNHIDENHADIKVNGVTSDVSLIANINQGGHVVLYKDKIYMSNDQGQLICMDTQLGNQKVIVNDGVGYMNIANDVIYYTDSKDQLCSVGIDGKDQKVIINKKVFYVVVKDNKIYYQSDTDEEKIFVYDLKTNKNTQLNDRRSYNLSIIDNKIYYTSTDGIYSIGTDGKGDEKLISGKAYIMVYNDKKLYYSTSDSEVKIYDIESQKAEILFNESGQFVNMNQQYIYYYSSKGLIRYDMETKKSKTVYSGSIQYCEIIGDKIIVTIKQYGASDSYRLIMELDGTHQQRLFQSDDGSYI